MSSPCVAPIQQRDTHRLVPEKYAKDDEDRLHRIANDDEHFQGIVNLAHSTDDRLLAEPDQPPGSDGDLLASKVPCYRTINAAFEHPHPCGSRFTGPDRGAWYAGFALETSQAEVAQRKSVEFDEIDWKENGEWIKESLIYDDYLADFDGPYHDIRDDATYAGCLNPDCYDESQKLGETLREQESAGIIYPSVRHHGGICLACFCPALVNNVRRSGRYRCTWTGSPTPKIEWEEANI